MTEVWNYITEFLTGIGQFWSWLSSPIDALGGWRPITIIGLGGLLVILGFWILKLVNPLS